MKTANTSELLRGTKQRLASLGDEAEPLSFLLLEEVLKISRTDILLNSSVSISTERQQKIDFFIDQLLQSIPIQYLLGKTEFYGRVFEVNENVLIPRQETEELVDSISKSIILEDYTTVLDVGTGSGCIAISLALDHPKVHVTGIDISYKALAVAQKNSKKLGVNINWLNADIFNYAPEKRFDLIVSNPPYVLESEKKEMNMNVIKYEPALALYVTDIDPLVYYTGITEFAVQSLSHNGMLYFEINERFGVGVATILEAANFHMVKIDKDLNGKERFVSGVLK